MRYDLSKLPITSLLRPISDAGIALARLDERIARSPVGDGWIERMHFSDACASLWIDGELVHLEDLVLHDAGADIRTPTHELTIATDVLRSRRRITAQPAAWALTPEGLRILRGLGGEMTPDVGRLHGAEVATELPAAQATQPIGEGEGPDVADPLAAELAAIDAVLARSDAAIVQAQAPGRVGGRDRNPLVYDLDWDEDERLAEWRTTVGETESLPPVLQAIIALDAWSDLQVLQHAPWLGRLLAAAILRQAGITTTVHLTAVNLGLKSISVDRRRHRHRDMRLAAILDGLAAAVEFGLKEHDRLSLARTIMERKLAGRRTSSKLPALIELVMNRPLVSAGMVSETLDVTPQAALRIVGELGLREMTGRGRFRAWGIV